jgi:ketosteroid isomerase-like protein
MRRRAWTSLVFQGELRRARKGLRTLAQRDGGSMTPLRPSRASSIDIAARLEAAFNAGDAAALAALYSDTATLMPPNEPMVSGKRDIRQWFDRALRRLERVRIVPNESRSVGSLAYQVGTFTSTTKGVTASPEIHGAGHTGKYILILLNHGAGDWLIQYDIWSLDEPIG